MVDQQTTKQVKSAVVLNSLDFVVVEVCVNRICRHPAWFRTKKNLRFGLVHCKLVVVFEEQDVVYGRVSVLVPNLCSDRVSYWLHKRLWLAWKCDKNWSWPVV